MDNASQLSLTRIEFANHYHGITNGNRIGECAIAYGRMFELFEAHSNGWTNEERIEASIQLDKCQRFFRRFDSFNAKQLIPQFEP